ncbi:hypothetical protein K8Z61_15965 [Nocardioides sp. TRM66260-LWL]|uniref:hypothetical protein n=1 Tax=Nocardioides sp. TRM66260-LWL TaxID=2874478 RepID=UPI001CC73BCF|nr:hypothetical protein [Nocardioides sp. TRM66260-LWL]MBZ5735990.1 hypothetical protein [Nocardioides sp. TRM66260-LWL]
MSARSSLLPARRPGAPAGAAASTLPTPPVLPGGRRDDRARSLAASAGLLGLVGVAWVVLAVLLLTGIGVSPVLLERVRDDLPLFGSGAVLGALGCGVLAWSASGRLTRATLTIAALGSLPAWAAAASALSLRF